MTPLAYWIIAFVIFDLIITLVVIRAVMAKRATGLPITGEDAESHTPLPDFGQLKEYSDAIHPRLGELVRMQWSGDAESLVTVLPMALDLADREARARGLVLDRDILKKFVESSLAKHGIARGSQIREALKQVA